MEIEYPVWLPKAFGSPQTPEEMNGLVQVLQNHAENLSKQQRQIMTSAGGIYPEKITPTSTLPDGISQAVFLVGPGTYTNFGNSVVPQNNLGLIFHNNSSFELSLIDIPAYDDTNLINRVAGVESSNTKFQNNVYQRIDDLETEQQDFIENFSVEVDQEFNEYSENAISNRAVTTVIGEIPIIDTTEIENIGITTSMPDNTLVSTSKYWLNNYTSNEKGVVKKVSIQHGSIALNTSFTVVHVRKIGDNFNLINSIVLLSKSQNSYHSYDVPNWEYNSNDYIGIIPDKANIIRYSYTGYNGIIPINNDNIIVPGHGIGSAALGLNFDLEKTIKGTDKTISERLLELESKTPTNYLPRPQSGVVNFQVDINTHISDVESQTTNKQDNEVILKDWGILLLPDNYTVGGDSIRLIITCHGTGTYINSNTNASNIIASSFWLSQGYALLDMNCLPDGLIGNGTNEQIRHYGSPYALQSMIKGYQYAIENYNIKKEVFLYGASMGGLISFQLALSNTIPIIAQGAFCPCIDIYKQAYSRPWNGANQRRYMTELFGFTGTPPTFTANVPPTQAEIDYFKLNYNKVIGYDNMMKGLIGGVYDEMHSINGANVTGVTNTNEDLLYTSKQKIHPVPLKIWHNTNDTVVLYRYSKYYVNMVRNLGGIAYLRTFTSGAHNAWLNGDIVSNIPTIDGGTTSINTSMYELLLWFKRFEVI